jgi:hypothetical protein
MIMATVREPWDESAQVRHAAKVVWPSLFGRDEEYLRLCERLRELGYDGCIASIHFESIIQAWRKADWVLLSPNGMHVRLTPKGKAQFAAWEEEDTRWEIGKAEISTNTTYQSSEQRAKVIDATQPKDLNSIPDGPSFNIALWRRCQIGCSPKASPVNNYNGVWEHFSISG